LARQFKFDITLLHVIGSRLVSEEPNFLSMENDRRIAAPPEAGQARAKVCAAYFVEKTLVTAGRPFEAIIHTAEGLRMDTIVIATHGRPGVKRLSLGSTAERVVRHSPCPVLTGRSPENPQFTKHQTASLAPRINRILVPVIFYEPFPNPPHTSTAVYTSPRPPANGGPT
jgi:nucleotide-binding universal stress UspA family protein